MKIGLTSGRVVIVHPSLNECNDDGIKCQLNVPHPQGSLGNFGRIVRAGGGCFFEDLFKVHTGQGRRDTRTRHGQKSCDQIDLSLFGRLFGRCFLLFSQYHHGHTKGNHHQTNPLLRTILALQHDDTQNGRRDQFELITHLKDGRRQIFQGKIQEGVLYQIQKGGNGNLECVDGFVHDMNFQMGQQTSSRSVMLQDQRGGQFSKFTNKNQMIYLILVFFGDAGSSVSSHQDGSRVLEDHHGE
mmetsp:Transcript_7149/g.14109  ORF Transcript_7149/g.14109 Transcript_7149/m.14109 type:complete len:242 (-) Transcript_7149:433-1158(-)